MCVLLYSGCAAMEILFFSWKLGNFVGKCKFMNDKY